MSVIYILIEQASGLLILIHVDISLSGAKSCDKSSFSSVNVSKYNIEPVHEKTNN